MNDLSDTFEIAKPAQTVVSPRPKLDLTEYGRARFMAMDTRPVSVQAENLIEDLTTRIEQEEVRSKSRRNCRGPDMLDKFRRAVGLLIGDLVLAADQEPKRWSYRQMSRASFSREDVSYRNFRTIFAALTELSLIEILPGYYDKYWSSGQATRLRATKRLLNLYQHHGVYQHHGSKHFQRTLPAKPLVLKARSKRMGHQKVSGRRIKFDHDERSLTLEADVKELNSFIAKHELDGGTHRAYHRIFNCGDDPTFDWNKGGRLYSLGKDSYQRQKKDARLKMCIDGEPIAEIDVRSSFLTILYAQTGNHLDLSTDPYEIVGLPRDVVKSWITVTLGLDRFPARWPSEKRKDFKKLGIELGKQYPVRKVQEAVLDVHPLLAGWPECSLTCFDLMYLESEAIVSTMLRLMREDVVVSLSVHDSLIVPKQQLDRARHILCEEYHRAVGVEPQLSVNEPT